MRKRGPRTVRLAGGCDYGVPLSAAPMKAHLRAQALHLLQQIEHRLIQITFSPWVALRSSIRRTV